MTTLHVEVCILGLGPAGLGTALCLAESPLAGDTICIEAGVMPDVRSCALLERSECCFAEPCHMITGVGGASVLSGSKVSVFPAGRAMASIIGSQIETAASLKQALRVFGNFVPLIRPTSSPTSSSKAYSNYAKKGFELRYYDAYQCRTKDLVIGYNRMLDLIKASGISVHLATEAFRVRLTPSGFLVSCRSQNRKFDLIADTLVFATGRFGTDFLRASSLALGLDGQPNQFDAGVRLEFPSSLWPDIDKHHNDLKLHFGNARTFCVTKDGCIAPYHYDGVFLVEGSSAIGTPSGLTNLAITVRIPPQNERDQSTLFAEVRRRYLYQSEGIPIRQSLVDFLKGYHPSVGRITENVEPASITFWHWGDAAACFPQTIATKIRGAVEYFVSRIFSSEECSLISIFAPELDYYWPRFKMNHGFESDVPGLYLVGDSTGHFRGILQAFCSGLKCAEHIARSSHVS